MKAPIDEFVSIIDRLATRLDELESRVAALEHSSLPHPSAVSAPPPAMLAQHPLAQVSRSSSVMPVIGKVFLGMAGAYLLRALAESSAMPRLAVACMALAYAGSWIVWAARISPAAIFAGAAYATTAAVILPPMLWELTLRFNVMPARAAAAVLAGFVACAAALAWRQRLAWVVWTPTISAAVAAVALLLGTRDPLPFIVALLLIALITEAAASSGRWPGARPLAALPLDVGMLALIAIYTSPYGVSSGYKPLSPGMLLRLFAALWMIYGASVLSHAVPLRRKTTGFEIFQMVAVFLLAGFGVLRITHNAAAPALGTVFLLLSAACYWCAFARFQSAGLRRNYHIFSAWAAALLVSGSLLAFPPAVNALWLGAAALAAIWIGVRSFRFSLAAHGLVYLAAMAVVSGLPQYCFAMLMGSPRPASWTVWTGYIFSLLGYAFAWRGLGRGLFMPGPEAHRGPAMETWQQRVLTLSLAALGAWGTLSAALAAALPGMNTATPAQIAAARTLVICFLALLLGWSGSRWRRPELLWLAYAFIALTTLKLLFEDLRSGSASVIAFSLFCYGMVWVLVPRLARSGKE
jgi:hypothetical protein